MHTLRHDDAHRPVASEDQVDERPGPNTIDSVASEIAVFAAARRTDQGDPELLRLIRAL